MNFVPGRKEEKNINWAPTMSQAFSWLFSQPCEMDIIVPFKRYGDNTNTHKFIVNIKIINETLHIIFSY